MPSCGLRFMHAAAGSHQNVPTERLTVAGDALPEAGNDALDGEEAGTSLTGEAAAEPCADTAGEPGTAETAGMSCSPAASPGCNPCGSCCFAAAAGGRMLAAASCCCARFCS